MSEDARFEDAHAAPLRLRALDTDDLAVISSLVQDSVVPRREVAWKKAERRFALLLNRFRWEDRAGGRAPERVRSLLVCEDVQRVQVRGLDAPDGEDVLSLLALQWQPAEDGTGCLLITLSGGGAIRVDAEALEVLLCDVTRPYLAPSGRSPRHP